MQLNKKRKRTMLLVAVKFREATTKFVRFPDKIKIIGLKMLSSY